MTRDEIIRMTTRKTTHIDNSARKQRDNNGCFNYLPGVKRPAQQDYRNTNPIKKQKTEIYLPTHKKRIWTTIPWENGTVDNEDKVQQAQTHNSKGELLEENVLVSLKIRYIIKSVISVIL